MKLIVASSKDVAGTNIAKRLLELYEFQKTGEIYEDMPIYQKTIDDTEVKLVTIGIESIQAQSITQCFSPDLLVFVSRHSSQSGIPTLSVHTPGNLTDQAEKGGFPKQVSISPAAAMKEALKEMERQVEEKRLSYRVSYECTHHGPSLNVPTMFAELGSSPAQWTDTVAAEAVAHAAVAAVRSSKEYPTVIGVGGPHYSEKFTKIALTKPTAFGHMIPKYAIAEIDADIVKQCVQKNVEKIDVAMLDWKGIKGGDKEKLVKTVNVAGLRMEKV